MLQNYIRVSSNVYIDFAKLNLYIFNNLSVQCGDSKTYSPRRKLLSPGYQILLKNTRLLESNTIKVFSERERKGTWEILLKLKFTFYNRRRFFETFSLFSQRKLQDLKRTLLGYWHVITKPVLLLILRVTCFARCVL